MTPKELRSELSGCDPQELVNVTMERDMLREALREAKARTCSSVVHVARCPEHGLHGCRDECFVCGGSVEQVAMVPLADLHPAVAECGHVAHWWTGDDSCERPMDHRGPHRNGAIYWNDKGDQVAKP